MLKFVKRQGLVNYVSLYVSNISKCFFFQISFIRRRDFHILTNGHNVYTTDKRVEILHAAKSHDWYLVISKANHNDSGIYECQVIFQSLKLLNNLVQLVNLDVQDENKSSIVLQNGTRKCGVLYSKNYCQFCGVLVKHFIKHKPLISEE